MSTIAALFVEHNGATVYEAEGNSGFLWCLAHPERAEQYLLCDTPPRTNQSREYRLTGWCGSHNNTSTHGMGVWQIVKILPNGRYKIAKLEGEPAAQAVKALGFPELVEGKR